MNNSLKGKRLIMFAAALSSCVLCAGCSAGRQGVEDAYDVFDTTSEYLLFENGTETEPDAGDVSDVDFFASDLCVGGLENTKDDLETADYAQAEALFSINDKTVNYAKNIYSKCYPASTTKILTAYLAIKYGDLDQVVTVSESVFDDIGYDSSLCYIEAGDRLTLRDLLYGLMLSSGNDAANAIAETISGSREAFVELMNEEAAALGATRSHFVNPHGMPDEDHYTTAYDLYLIFQAAVANEEFVNIISTDRYTASYVHANGEAVEQEWVNTNGYLDGTYAMPEGVRVIGGKTGTTDAAGACLVLYSENSSGAPIISVVMKAETHEELYECMSDLLSNFSD